MWKEDNIDSYIVLKKHDTGEHPLYSSRIIVLHQFPGLFMNVFHGDEGLTPLFKFPIGKVIISCEMTMEDRIWGAEWQSKFEFWTRIARNGMAK